MEKSKRLIELGFKRGSHLFSDDLITGFSVRDPIDFCVNKGYLDEDHRIVIGRGNNWTVLVVCGYLRQHCINPADISTIIAKFISRNQNNINTINFSVCNDHQDILVLFPGMSQISIEFSQLYRDNSGCILLGCTNMHLFHCGIIGFPSSNSNPIASVHVGGNNICNTKQLPPSSHNSTNNNINYSNSKSNHNWSISKFYKKMHLLSGVPTSTHHNLSIDSIRTRFDMKKSDKCEIIDCCIEFVNDNWGTTIDPKKIQVKYSVHHGGEKINGEQETQYLKSKGEIDISKDGFSFKQGDKVTIKHLCDKSKNLNQFSITVCGKIEYNCDDNSHYDDDDDDDNNYVYKEKTLYKVDLKQCYDYVTVCCVYGCDTRVNGKNNVFKVTGKQ